MIINDDVSQLTNIEIAMRRAREEGQRKNAAAAQAMQGGIITLSTDDIPGIEEIIAEYQGESTAAFTTHGQVGVRDDGQPIYGETRVYIVTESQEKDKNQNQETTQSAVEAAAQAAAGEMPNAETVLHETNTMSENTVNAEAATEAKPDQPSEEKQSGFKHFFARVGNKVSSLKEHLHKTTSSEQKDPAVVLEEVKALCASAVADIATGMQKLPKGIYVAATPTAA
jgi:hypothetical protein